MTILSFDQASVTSGWAYSIDGHLIESGTIKKNPKIPIETRMQDMAKSICQKIKDVNPDLVVIEDVQNQSSIVTVIQLARLQGSIMFYCAIKNIRIEILHPSAWRKVLRYHQGKGTKREDLKQQSIDYVREHLDLDVESEDQNEAICINIAAQKLFNNTK